MGSDIAAEEIAKAAKVAFEESQLLPATVRIDALAKIKQQLQANKAEILAANKQDMEVQHRFSRLKIHDDPHTFSLLPYQGSTSRGRCR
jgi:gamma-glutamyl phosphate reductase